MPKDSTLDPELDLDKLLAQPIPVEEDEDGSGGDDGEGGRGLPSIGDGIMAELAALLAQGHKQFGTLGKRLPIPSERSGHGPSNAFKQHPYLKDLPLGDGRNLSQHATENIHAEDEADRREHELSNRLTHRLGKQYTPGAGNAPRATR